MDHKIATSAAVKTTLSVGIVVDRGHTGRKVSVEDLEATRELRSLSRVQLHASPRGRDIVALLVSSGLPTVEFAGNIFYRARVAADHVNGWDDMGPPPAEKTREGRYNAAGRVVLYLSSRLAGVRAEMCKTLDTRIYTQIYVFGDRPPRVADLSGNELPGALLGAFEFAESAQLEGRDGPTDFVFSQWLAECVAAAGYDGFLVPGVRGDATLTYSNMVIFEASGWRCWSQRQAGFRIPVEK